MAFDKAKYDYEYDKNNYKRPTIRYKLDLWRKIEEYCAYNGLTASEFCTLAAKYIIDEKVDLNGYK